MGEDPRPRRRLLGRVDRPLTDDAVRTVFRGVWKLVFVLVVTFTLLSGLGWALQALGDDAGGRDETATTVDEPE